MFSRNRNTRGIRHNGKAGNCYRQSLRTEYKLLIASIQIDKCTGCSSCVKVCPAKAIRLDSDSKKAFVDSALCRGCGICATVCPKSAITFT